jgi:hypothetical protein
MSVATGKAAFSQDEVDIRALIEAAHQVLRVKDAAAIVAVINYVDRVGRSAVSMTVLRILCRN